MLECDYSKKLSGFLLSFLALSVQLVLAAIPFLTVSLFKTERSPRLAVRMHAVMFEQSGRRFLHVLGVCGLRRGFRHLVHRPLLDGTNYTAASSL
jgi:hypothetical protein